MNGETSLAHLLEHMSPQLNPGEYVFSTVSDPSVLDPHQLISSIREAEGLSVIVEHGYAEQLGLPFDYVAAWITLNVHSALSAVGLTAAFASALGQAQISCNVVAGHYHDHIFVAKADATRAMEVLKSM
ncbi:ACT domain-containing protein [Pseudomonas sp. nanlin1]|uniref:ACT domain-containing protein n=1 Tax=Pseudomonas sp. nanlin1 TaxID=3040605 RepID=UPI0038908150